MVRKAKPLNELFSSNSVVVISQLSCFSLFLEFFEIFILITVLGNYIICLYLLYFDNRIWENWHFILTSYAFDVIFIFNSVLKLIKTCILRGEQFQPMDVRKPSRCLRPWEALRRTLDILSCIPIELILWIGPLANFKPRFSTRETSKLKLHIFALLRSNRVLRIHRAVEYYLLETDTRKTNLYRRQIQAIIITFIFFLIALFHGCACLWYSISCEPVYIDKPGVCVERHLDHGDPFYQKTNVTSADPWGWYIGSLQWSIMTVRNAGNYYIPPITTPEFVISVAFMTSGFLITACILCLSIYVFGEIDICRQVYCHEAHRAIHFIKHLRMKPHILKCTFNCFNTMWRNGVGYIDNITKKVLPERLKINIVRNYFELMVSSSELLNILTPRQRDAICLEAEFRQYFENEFLIRPNTIGNAAYYIIEGNVQIISYENFRPILALSSGSLIGEVNLFTATYRRYGVKTSSTCSVVKLKTQSVLKVLALNPDARSRIYRILMKRMKWATRISKRKTCPRPELENQNFESVPENVSTKEISDAKSNAKESVMLKSHIRPPSIENLQFVSFFGWLCSQHREYDECIKDKHNFDAENDMQKCFRNNASRTLYKVMKGAINSHSLCHCKFLIVSKDSSLYVLWNILVILSITFNTIFFPISLVIFKESFVQPLNVYVDIVYTLDLILRLFVFRNANDVSLPLTVHFFREFGKIEIWIDIISAFPLYNIAIILRKKYDHSYQILRSNTFVKFGRVIIVMWQWENDVTMHTRAFRFLKHGTFLTFITLFIACVMARQRCGDDYRGCAFDNHTVMNPNDPNRFHFEEKGQNIIEICLYWGVCVIFGIGFTDIAPLNREERTIHSVSLMIGLIFVVYFYSDLAATFAAASERKIIHQDNKMWLHDYLDEDHMHMDLIKRIDRYMNIQWLLLKGINTNQEVHSVGFLSVSHLVHREFVIYIISEVLYNSELSKLVNLDADLIRQLSLMAKLAVVPPREILLAAKDFVRRVYIIRRGIAEVTSVTHGTGLGLLCKGQCIGFGEMLYQVPSRVQVKTVTYLEVIIIDAAAFEKIAQNSKIFGDIWTNLKYNEGFKKIFRDAYKKLNLPYYSENNKVSAHERRELLPTQQIYIHGDIRTKEGARDESDEDWQCCTALRCCRKCLLLWSCLPWTTMMKVWEGIRVITIILVTLCLPLVEAFPYLKKKYTIYVYFFDSVTIFDMFIRMNLAYFEPRLNQLITNPLQTTGHYLSTSFIIDFLASPIVYYGIEVAFQHAPIGWDLSIYAYLLRLNRMLLLYHLFQVYLFMDDKVSSGKTSWKLLKLVPLLFFHAHIMACILAVTSCPAKIPYPNPRCKANTWISSSQTLTDPASGGRSARNITDWQIYVFGFYYAATTLVGCGFGDFLPANYQERCFTAFLFYAYIFALAYLLATVAGSKCPLDYKILQHYQEMDYLMGYFQRENVNSQAVGSTLKYFDYDWHRTKGVEPHKVFSRMYPALKKEVLTCMYEHILSKVEIFQDFPQSVLRILCTHFVPVYCPEHTVVLRQGDMYDMFYLVKRGQLMIRVGDEWVKAVKEGDIIGLDVMNDDNKSVTCLHTVVTTTKTELLAIKMKDFYSVLDIFLTNILKEEEDDLSESEDELKLIETSGEISLQTESLIFRLLNFSSSKWSKYQKLSEKIASAEIRRDLKVKDIFQRFFERKRKGKQGDLDSDETSDDENSSESENHSNNNKNMENSCEKKCSQSKCFSIGENSSGFEGRSENRFLAVDMESDEDDSIGGVQGLPGVVTLSSEIGTDLYEQSRANPKFSKDLITPEPFEVLLLNSSVLIAASLSVCLVCYQAAFKNIGIPFIVLGYMCDLVYLLKIIFSFCLRYVDNFGNPVTASTDIQTRYLGSLFGFTWDFISTFPLEMLAPLPPKNVPDKMYFFCLLRLNRAIRLFHIWTYFRVNRNDGGFVARHLLRRKLLRLFCYTSIYLHLATCFLQTYTLLHCGSFKLSDPVQCLPTTQNISWVHTKIEKNKNYQDSPYIFTLYFIMSAFTTTAYGDVVPVTKFEMIYIAVVAISSKIWLGLALSDILSGLQNTTTVTYHLATRITLKLFDEKFQAPGHLIVSAEEYLTYAWIRNRGVLIPECLNRVPICLKMDIFSDAYGDHLRTSYLFRNLGECFFRQACLRLKHCYILPQDYIVHSGDIGSSLYFVHKGIVRYNQIFLDDEGLVVREEGRISRYQCFGEENALLGPYPYQRTYRAETFVEIVYLTHSDAGELFALFPSHKKKVLRRLHSKTMGRVAWAKETCSRRDVKQDKEEKRGREAPLILPQEEGTEAKNNLVDWDEHEMNSESTEVTDILGK